MSKVEAEVELKASKEEPKKKSEEKKVRIISVSRSCLHD